MKIIIQTDHPQYSALTSVAGVCEGNTLGNIALMVITVVAFEGKYLICEDCKTRNSRMLCCSSCLQEKQNRDSDKRSVPCSLRTSSSPLTVSIKQK